MALRTDSVIDITTTGRRSGEARRIEIWIRFIEGRWFVAGTPGRRDWLANLRAEPRLIVHLKRSLTADLPALATEVIDAGERRRIFEAEATRWHRDHASVEELVAGSPLVEVLFDQ